MKKFDGKPIDCLLLAKNDWAGTGARFWRCLCSLGLNAIMFKGEQHVFGYPHQAPIHPSLTGLPIDLYPVTVMTPYLESLLSQAKVIHFIASTFIVCPAWKWNGSTKVVVQHGGSTYRLAPERSNAVFNPIVTASIIQCPDLLGLGAKNEHLIYYPVDTDAIQPVYERQDPDKLIIGHFPSDPSVKGTADIVKVIEEMEQDPALKDRFSYVGVRNPSGTQHWVSWEQNLERMAACDVIIETVNPEIQGKQFGEWGNTALEAAALGKLVITNSHWNGYEREYGAALPLFIANNAHELQLELKPLLFLDDHGRRRLMRRWVEQNHSIPATAQRLWDRVYRDLLG